jgi:hypothetical protein
MRRLSKCLVAVACAGLLLSACAGAGGPDLKPVPAAGLPAPEGGQGRIVFYRPRASLFPAVDPQVIVNGRLVGDSLDGVVFYRDAWPGDYEVFLTSDRDNPVVFTLGPGESLYVRTSIGFGLTGPRLAPELVNETHARREIRGLGLIEPQSEA